MLTFRKSSWFLASIPQSPIPIFDLKAIRFGRLAEKRNFVRKCHVSPLPNNNFGRSQFPQKILQKSPKLVRNGISCRNPEFSGNFPAHPGFSSLGFPTFSILGEMKLICWATLSHYGTQKVVRTKGVRVRNFKFPQRGFS